MNNICKTSRLRMHANYMRLADQVYSSHLRGRTTGGIADGDIALARLYSHAFRGHIIGAFHATAQAIEKIPDALPLVAAHLSRAIESLAVLSNRSMDAVGHDARALVSTFHHYCTHVAITLDALDAVCDRLSSTTLHRIRDLFVRHMERVTACNGLYLTQDTSAPEQASFSVPNLGITIVPLVYGDHHSWNLAWLDGERSDVPCHLHQQGVEIHLGYSPLHGYTMLGDAQAEVTQGYAMPIPPKTRHGYTNLGDKTHHVPFIFGSLTCGGWGVFLDVDPLPTGLDQFVRVPISSSKLNGTVMLEQEIEKAAMRNSTTRYPIIPAEKTDRGGVGGLELSVGRVASGGIRFELDRFCAASVVRGHGVLTMANESIDISPHDHFGIPAGLTATITETGSEPLVLLDAVIR